MIAFQGTSREVPQIDNHRVILSGQAEGGKYAMTEYYVSAHEGAR